MGEGECTRGTMKIASGQGSLKKPNETSVEKRVSSPLSVESTLRLLWSLLRLEIGLKKNSRHFLNQSELKPKLIVTC